MLDLTDTHAIAAAIARSFGAEVASPWFYLQVGLMLAGGGIAIAAGAMVRVRIDTTSSATGWPAPLRMLFRVLVDSASTAIFAVLMAVARVTMLSTTWPSRSYLLTVAAK